jgi:hypothetical protein
VDREFGADFTRQRLLALLIACLLELVEQVLDLAVIGFQQGDRVARGLFSLA